jgi:ubiquinone/menaquinone biosynthesis C-methylase UbiE
MLGDTLDTKIFRLFCHDRNLMTEEQIEREREELASNQSFESTDEDFRKFTERSLGYFDYRGKKIVDLASGGGDLVNHLAMNGASEAYGVEIQPDSVMVAESVAAREGIANAKFIASDFHKWQTDEKFDYVLTNEALDHIPDVGPTMKKMASLLKDDGRIINFAAGFWKAPVGADHCDDFMRLHLPWTQLIFSDQARLNVRREKFRPSDPATSWGEIRGGLSMYTYSGYKKAIRDAGLKIVAWDVNYQLKYIKRGWLYRPFSAVLTRIPGIREYFTFSVMSVLEKA